MKEAKRWKVVVALAFEVRAFVSFAASSNRRSTTRGQSPGSDGEPTIVNVLPAPVWPYVKTVLL